MKVLLIEDESMLANLIVRGLSGEGWQMSHAASAEEGLELLNANDFDVLLLDRTLPGMSGTDLCRRLRESDNFIPILMLTALGEVSDRVGGLSAGADDYLSKPFDFDELIARVGALGRRARQYKGVKARENLQLGDLSFNGESLQILLHDSPLELTAKERELLAFFMQYPNRAFSREEILDHVWGEDADPFSNIVDVYIGKLRRKIGEADVQIDTVRGAGYRLSHLHQA